MRRRTVMVDGVPTVVVAAGPNQDLDRRATVFVHGNPGSSAEFLHLANGASRFGRAIAMDMPGFGHTPPWPDTTPSVEAYARHLGLLLDELGIDEVDLVLHDFGGPWGLAWAADHPDRVRSILLMNTLGAPGYRWHKLAKLWRTPIIGELAMAASTRTATGVVLREGNPVPIPNAHVDAMADHLSGPRGHVVLELYRDTPPDWGDLIAPRLAVLDVPVRVVWGDRDPYIPIETAQNFRQVFPHASFVRLRDVGHWPMLTHREVTDDVVLHWLAGRR